MTNLRVSLIQTSLAWLNPLENRQRLQEQLLPLMGKTDLVILPEMFTSGFITQPENLIDNDVTIDWLLQQAKNLDAAIAGSIAMAVEGGTGDHPTYVNRLLFASPKGQLDYYDKVHLFRMGDEHKHYRPGNQRKIVTCKEWRLLLTVCYDLRFPVFCRNRNDYDLLLCVANWPQARRHHWRTLLTARAIENQAYVVGVNRVGTDGKGLNYSGDSMVIDHLGNTLIDQPGEWVATKTLSAEELTQYRTKFPAWQDADDFALHLNG